MTRVGTATFVRPRKNDGTVPKELTEEEEEAHIKGTAEVKYWSDEDFKKIVLPNIVSSEDTWGPIGKEVRRVEVLII